MRKCRRRRRLGRAGLSNWRRANDTGWRGEAGLKIPDSLRLVFLPPYSGPPPRASIIQERVPHIAIARPPLSLGRTLVGDAGGWLLWRRALDGQESSRIFNSKNGHGGGISPWRKQGVLRRASVPARLSPCWELRGCLWRPRPADRRRTYRRSMRRRFRISVRPSLLMTRKSPTSPWRRSISLTRMHPERFRQGYNLPRAGAAAAAMAAAAAVEAAAAPGAVAGSEAAVDAEAAAAGAAGGAAAAAAAVGATAYPGAGVIPIARLQGWRGHGSKGAGRSGLSPALRSMTCGAIFGASGCGSDAGSQTLSRKADGRTRTRASPVSAEAALPPAAGVVPKLVLII